MAFATALAAAPPAHAASITATVKAKVIKPLSLKSISNFDLGTIILSQGTWSGAVVRLTRTGTFTCPAQATCTGARTVAGYNISGSNGERAIIRAPNVILTNQANASKKLTLVPDAPASVTFTNSGSKGIDFPVGGSITIDSTTAGGTYVGTFNVTAEYQ
ncbi:DUF4402 domain-containing protein [Sphingomonas sabuli]|uniref:DUF4402 domain-containing protein n=1 Tax=Sphingomonas sabuli TaxID=2764186 RepID=A0A7G9L4W7_9SPHN|nr:DUF4402 domain-containing protein [Sphingomonas sabuli]QNM83666.1 DUF4402 domain-containing protein [Sphingomonas sabuli]